MDDFWSGLLPSGFSPLTPLDNLSNNLTGLLPSGWNPSHPIDNIITNLGGTVGDGSDTGTTTDSTSGAAPWIIGAAVIFGLLLLVILLHEVKEVI